MILSQKRLNKKEKKEKNVSTSCVNTILISTQKSSEDEKSIEIRKTKRNIFSKDSFNIVY